MTDFEWRVIKPLLPNKPRVDDRLSMVESICIISEQASPSRIH